MKCFHCTKSSVESLWTQKKFLNIYTCHNCGCHFADCKIKRKHSFNKYIDTAMSSMYPIMSFKDHFLLEPWHEKIREAIHSSTEGHLLGSDTDIYLRNTSLYTGWIDWMELKLCWKLSMIRCREVLKLGGDL